ncbi:hypothetical protein ACHQM5_010924 [Ranunculus cassubicifolius]
MDPLSIQKHLSGIDMLTDSNYSSWKLSIQIVLGYLEYDFVLTEDQPVFTGVDTPTQVDARQKWVKANNMASLIIRSRIDPIMRGGIPQTLTAKELFATIKQQFEGSVKGRQYSNLAQLLSLKYDGNGGVRTHILKVSKLVLTLRELGLAIDDTLMVHFAVFSLPRSFEMLQVNYQNQEREWSLNELIAACVSEEERHKNVKAESAHMAIVHPKENNVPINSASKQTFKHKGKSMVSEGNDMSSDDCFFCKKPGHKKRDCYRYKAWLAKRAEEHTKEDSTS